MSANGLDAYSVTVRQLRDKEEKLLGSFHKTSNFAEVIFNILKTAEGYHHHLKLYGKCVTFASVSKSGHSITGLAQAGDYGYSNRLINIDSGKTTYKKKQSDASLIPFFFEWYLPPRQRKGILLSQRIGQSGVRTALTAIVSGEFEKLFPGYKIDIVPLMPEAAIKALLKKAVLHEVRFVQNIIPSDIADRFNGTKTAQDGELEFVIRPKRKGYLNSGALLDYLSGKKTVGDLVEIESFKPDNVKAEISIDNRRRVINFGELGRLRATFDISGDMNVGADGYASLASLKSASAVLVEDLAAQLKIKS
jgi:hypothetical protein